MVKVNSCVFISGKGTNLMALINSSREYNFPVNIKLVISNKKNALGLNYAKRFSIPFIIVDTNKNNFEIKILNEIKRKKISLICLAGFMRILSKKFIKNFKGNIINIHPSLLPKFKGINTFERILKNNETQAGCTVHHVSDKLDSGKIILKRSFLISKEDSISTLKAKTQRIEYKTFSAAIMKLYSIS